MRRVRSGARPADLFWRAAPANQEIHSEPAGLATKKHKRRKEKADRFAVILCSTFFVHFVPLCGSLFFAALSGKEARVEHAPAQAAAADGDRGTAERRQ